MRSQYLGGTWNAKLYSHIMTSNVGPRLRQYNSALAQVQLQVQFTPQGATRLAPHVMYGFLKRNSTVYICVCVCALYVFDLFYVKCMHAGQHKFAGVARKWF